MDEYEMLSSRVRRKKPSVSLSCCFNGHQRADSLDATSSSIMPSPTSSSRVCPSSSLKGRYKNLVSRMGRQRRHSSADYSYDPLSYSLNFQDNDDPFDGEDSPIRSFSSRLPLSPPGSRMANTTSIATPPCAATRKTMNTASSSGKEKNTIARATNKGVGGVNKSSWKLEEMRRNLDITTPPMKEKTSTAAEAASSMRNIDLFTQRAAAAEVRRSYECEEVSAGLVASPAPRQVLIELC